MVTPKKPDVHWRHTGTFVAHPLACAAALATLDVLTQIQPKVLVPGHGSVTNVTTALADSQAYLLALRAHMKQAVDDGVDMSAAIRSFNTAPYLRLLNAAELMPGNASRTYLEIERE